MKKKVTKLKKTPVKTHKKHPIKKKTLSKGNLKGEFMSLGATLEENLLYVSMYALSFLVAINILLADSGLVRKDFSRSFENHQVLAAQDIKTTIKPLIINDRNLSFPIISAQGVLAVDLDSGEYLYDKNSDKLMLPASTVKIMTALVAMENMPGNMPIEIGEMKVEGQKMRLYEGQKIDVDNLLKGLLVFSANDAAEALAENIMGGKEEFVKLMNTKVSNLGLADTIYTNPSGIDGVNQVTTASDLIEITKYALMNPKFAELVKQKSVQIYNIDGELFRTLNSTNELLDKVEGVQGVKTGWTENARENLVTYVDRNGRRILIAILGSQDRFGETEELIQWIYDNYEWVEVPLEGTP